MSILSVKNLTCVQNTKTLFQDISFGIEEGEKVALIGLNGCGKSTLLNHIIAHAKGVSDTVVVKKGLKITYLPQLPTFKPEHTILDHLFSANTATSKVIAAYHRCLEDEALHDELGAIMAEMDVHQAWDYEAKVTAILNELNIHHLNQKMSTLSGGMLKKVSLAQLFFEDTDLLILDEPTNHLDIETIAWLEHKLEKTDSTLLMVTHDRYFLDKICTKLIEIDEKKLFQYKGNYQDFLAQKEQRLLSQQKAEDTIQSILRVELAWLRRGAKARSTKQKARKQRIEAMQNREGLQQEEAFELGVAARRLGKKILELKDISKSFQDKPLIKDFSYTFKHQEKIGVLGPNGSGKTTLLNLISGRMDPDSGEIDRGINTVFGYFDQHRTFTNPELTLYELIKEIGERITLHDGTELSASKLLERFLFPSSVLKTKICDLSGGEQRRLQLVHMLLSNPNFLLFDEPTNDLDITTLSILEDFLIHFSGCVIIISHDRYFMDRVVDQLLVVTPGQKITHFAGTYSDYREAQKEQKEAEKERQKEKLLQKEIVPALETQTGLTKYERQEMKKLESEIEKLELEVKRLNSTFLNHTATILDYQNVGKRLKEIEVSLGEKQSRWDNLAARA